MNILKDLMGDAMSVLFARRSLKPGERATAISFVDSLVVAAKKRLAANR